MNKTLSNIMTVFKVMRILAKVVFILCIVGGIGSLIGLVLLPFANILSAKTLSDFGIESAGAYSACIIGVIACIGEAYLAFIGEKYFMGVLNRGTPFTLEGSKECFKLGLTSIIASAAVSLISLIVIAVFSLLSIETAEINVGTSISVSLGLFLMFLSMIFKYVAESENNNGESL